MYINRDMLREHLKDEKEIARVLTKAHTLNVPIKDKTMTDKKGVMRAVMHHDLDVFIEKQENFIKTMNQPAYIEHNKKFLKKLKGLRIKMELTTEEQEKISSMIESAKTMKPNDLETFVEKIRSSDNVVLRQAILEGIDEFILARKSAEVERGETKGEVC